MPDLLDGLDEEGDELSEVLVAFFDSSFRLRGNPSAQGRAVDTQAVSGRGLAPIADDYVERSMEVIEH